MSDIEWMRTRISAYLLNDYPRLIRTVLTCADATAASRPDGFSVADGPADLLCERLERSDVIKQLPSVLAGAVNQLNSSLTTEPVAAPPYVVVTNVGPVMRATVDDRRLVITIEAFHIERNSHRYVRTTNVPEEALTIELPEQP